MIGPMIVRIAEHGHSSWKAVEMDAGAEGMPQCQSPTCDIVWHNLVLQRGTVRMRYVTLHFRSELRRTGIYFFEGVVLHVSTLSLILTDAHKQSHHVALHFVLSCLVHVSYVYEDVRPHLLHQAQAKSC